MTERAWEHIDRSHFPRPRDGGQRAFVWAHRGASALEPENTLRAFARAAELGSDGVELDVQLTRDGVAVVIHDPTIWTDGERLFLQPPAETRDVRALWVRDLDWAELGRTPVMQLDGSLEPLARFEEVLEAVPPWLWLNVELKAGWTYERRLADVFCQCARRRPECTLASSFDHVTLRDVATINPEVPLLAILHARPVDLVRVLGSVPAAMASIDRPFLSAEDVARWTAAGVEIAIGGRELLEDLPAVLAWPPAAVFLDDPRLGLPAPA